MNILCSAIRINATVHQFSFHHVIHPRSVARNNNATTTIKILQDKPQQHPCGAGGHASAFAAFFLAIISPLKACYGIFRGFSIKGFPKPF
jgi:hypothetical protein